MRIGKRRTLVRALKRYYANERSIASPVSEFALSNDFAHVSLASFVRAQVFEVSGWVWLAQLFLIGLMYVCATKWGQNDPTHVVLSLLSIGTVMVGIPDLAKGRAHHMYELEATTTFALGPILLVRLVILGASQVLAITSMCGILTAGARGALFSVVVSACLPYFLALAGSLACVRSGRVNNPARAMAVYNVGLMGALFVCALEFHVVFAAMSWAMWMLVLVGAFAWLVVEAVRFVKSQSLVWQKGY